MGVKTYRIGRNGKWVEPFSYPTFNQARWVLCQRPGGEDIFEPLAQRGAEWPPRT